MTLTAEPVTNGHPVGAEAERVPRHDLDTRPVDRPDPVRVAAGRSATTPQGPARVDKGAGLFRRRRDRPAPQPLTRESVDQQIREAELGLELELAQAGIAARRDVELARFGDQRRVQQARTEEETRTVLADLDNGKITHEGTLRRQQQRTQRLDQIADEQADHELWMVRADLEQRRATSIRSWVADLSRWARTVDRVLIGATVVGMVVSAVIVQQGLVAANPKQSGLMTAASFGLEALFSLSVAVIMSLVARLAQGGRDVQWWLVGLGQAALVGISGALAVVPRVGMVDDAWVYAAAPLGVGVVVAVHTAVMVAKSAAVRRAAEETGLELRRAIETMDPQTAHEVYLAHQAFAAMDRGELVPSQDEGHPPAPSALALTRWLGEQGVGGGKPLAGRVRDKMRTIAAASDRTITD
ncbi:MAG: hypothetical protein HOV94_27605 [Saccharothrix sp.]|nr:hypothetical protein [Saccharothrix sp.]